KFVLLKRFLEYVGIEKGRVRFSWISASEGPQFAELIQKVTDEVKELGPAERLVKEAT
ncbi:MAG: hydrogenase iron-sulfur subunit, partial [Planctomycetes bacterium]|nr:hydrogenase iron-sulfur subunit [Planctomycetota bacterium]